MPDWSMDGGGLHQTLRGGHLNIHADFTTHHDHDNWARRVNILLYLNEEWNTDEWGGQLELWDPQMTACQAKVTPAGNRMLVFTTTFDSFHGHPDPLTCPEDVARRSMALYYFTEEEKAVRRSTNYQARPDESAPRRQPSGPTEVHWTPTTGSSVVWGCRTRRFRGCWRGSTAFGDAERRRAGRRLRILARARGRRG